MQFRKKKDNISELLELYFFDQKNVALVSKITFFKTLKIYFISVYSIYHHNIFNLNIVHIKKFIFIIHYSPSPHVKPNMYDFKSTFFHCLWKFPLVADFWNGVFDKSLISNIDIRYRCF